MKATPIYAANGAPGEPATGTCASMKHAVPGLVRRESAGAGFHSRGMTDLRRRHEWRLANHEPPAFVPPPRRPVGSEWMLVRVSVLLTLTGISFQQLAAMRGTRELVRTRTCIMWCLRNWGCPGQDRTPTWWEVAKAVGADSHSTAWYGCERVENDHELKNEARLLLARAMESER